jgi:tetratricopeptide (TPR) repeat protein
MYDLVILLSILIHGAQETVTPTDRARITITNSEPANAYLITRFDAGPSVGSMLENHFFPGIDYYNNGKYQYAQQELDYVIRRPENLIENVRRNNFLSVSHYLLGMIYMYHANGLGRRNVAREHFIKAIEYQPNNHIAHLELARVYAELRLTKQASEIIQQLLELKPEEDIATQARDELAKLSSNTK